VVRRRENQIGQACILGVGAVYFLVMGLSTTSRLVASLLVLIAAGSVVLAVRAWRMGVEFEPTHLLVRGLFVSRRVPIDAVDCCVKQTVGLHGPLPTLKLVDGTKIRLFSLAGPNAAVRRNNRDVDDAVEYINALLALP